MINIDIVNKVVADKLGINEKIISEVNKYYWKEGVKKKLRTLESSSVFVKGLLTFTLSKYNVNKEIIRTIHKIRNTKTSDKFKDSTKELYIEEWYKRLRLLLIKRNELAILYYEQSKRNHKSNAKNIS